MKKSFFAENSDDLEFWHKNTKAFKPLTKAERDKAKLSSKQQFTKPILTKKQSLSVNLDNIIINSTKSDIKKVNSPVKQSSLAASIVIARNDLAKIKTNKVKIDKKIDLHNLKIEEAYNKTLEFLENCQMLNYKLVVIITGKGKNSQNKENTIKINFLNWITSGKFQQYILQYSPALIKDGGDGAFYVILKKLK
jgi:DNA-nicking Smr family endonuclease